MNSISTRPSSIRPIAYSFSGETTLQYSSHHSEIGGPSYSVSFREGSQWRERPVRRLDSRSVNACKLTISVPIEAAQHEANSLSPCKSMTHHFPYCSDKLSRLRAAVRIDRVTLF